MADDGQGIDTGRLKALAVETGRLSAVQAQALSPERAMALVFESGLSTTAQATDLSGRGLGLAIVREQVEKLGGTISVASSRDRGTEFQVTLPVTLARLRGVVVDVGDQSLRAADQQREQIVRRQRGEIRQVENREAIDTGAAPCRWCA